jgi:branched-chain amino acid transport system substrate-binding protein
MRLTSRSYVLLMATWLCASIVLAACGSQSSTATTFKGTVSVGDSVDLSQAGALYGKAQSQGLQLAAEDANAAGGVNRYKVQVVVTDDTGDVTQAVQNTQNFILQNQVVALFGNVNSGQCAATSPLSKQHKIPMIVSACNSYQLFTAPTTLNPYLFSVVPSTYAEGCAAGTDAGKHGTTNIFVMAPDNLFGRSVVPAFLTCLRNGNSAATVVNDPANWYLKYPPASWAPQIAQIQAKKPSLVYAPIFGGGEISFIQQATQTDAQWFQKYPFTTQASVDELQTLGASYPLGQRVYSRAPFYAVQTQSMTTFVSRYRSRFNEYPTDYAVMAYDAFNLWAQAADAASSFDGDKVRSAILAKPFASLRGYNLTIRSSDGQADVGEVLGSTASSGGKYSFAILSNLDVLKGSDIIMPAALVLKLQAGQCKDNVFTNC